MNQKQTNKQTNRKNRKTMMNLISMFISYPQNHYFLIDFWLISILFLNFNLHVPHNCRNSYLFNHIFLFIFFKFELYIYIYIWNEYKTIIYNICGDNTEGRKKWIIRFHNKLIPSKQLLSLFDLFWLVNLPVLTDKRVDG